MSDLKPIQFLGTSLDDLRAFPVSVKREAGYQFDQVQHGQEPNDWKSMVTIGHGVQEIRIRDAFGGFRIIYVAKFANAIYILHCFQKKTQKTSISDLNRAKVSRQHKLRSYLQSHHCKCLIFYVEKSIYLQ